MIKRVKGEVAKNTKKNEKLIEDLNSEINELKIANCKALNKKI